jgi:hypothetical protein
MVHTWLRIKNGKIIEDDGPKSMGARHFRRAMIIKGTYFNSTLNLDYEDTLDVYIGQKDTYDSLWATAKKSNSV